MSRFLIAVSLVSGFYFAFKSQVSFSDDNISTQIVSASFSKPDPVLNMWFEKKVGWRERLGFKGTVEKFILNLDAKVTIENVKLNFVLVKNTEIISTNIPDQVTLVPGKILEFEISIKRSGDPHLILRAHGLLPDKPDEMVYLGTAHFYRNTEG